MGYGHRAAASIHAMRDPRCDAHSGRRVTGRHRRQFVRLATRHGQNPAGDHGVPRRPGRQARCRCLRGKRIPERATHPEVRRPALDRHGRHAVRIAQPGRLRQRAGHLRHGHVVGPERLQSVHPRERYCQQRHRRRGRHRRTRGESADQRPQCRQALLVGRRLSEQERVEPAEPPADPGEQGKQFHAPRHHDPELAELPRRDQRRLGRHCVGNQDPVAEFGLYEVRLCLHVRHDSGRADAGHLLHAGHREEHRRLRSRDLQQGTARLFVHQHGRRRRRSQSGRQPVVDSVDLRAQPLLLRPRHVDRQRDRRRPERHGRDGPLHRRQRQPERQRAAHQVGLVAGR